MVHKPGQPFSSFTRRQALPERVRDGLKALVLRSLAGGHGDDRLGLESATADTGRYRTRSDDNRVISPGLPARQASTVSDCSSCRICIA